MRKRSRLVAAACVLTLAFSLTACSKGDGKENQTQNSDVGSQYKNDVSTADLISSVSDKLGDRFWPNMDVDAEYLTGTCEIDKSLYSEFAGKIPMVSFQVDTAFVLKAADGKTADLEAAVKKYRDRLANDTMQYPMNLEKIKASEVAVFGNYVVFVQLGADAVDAESEEKIVEGCKKDNKAALDAIKAKLAK